MMMPRQMNRTAWLTGVLTLALGLTSCFTAEDPEKFKCGNNESECQDGYKCDPVKGVCVPEDTKLDARVDGPLADKGKDMASDKGKDMAPDKDKDMAPDKGKDMAPDKGKDMAPEKGMDMAPD